LTQDDEEKTPPVKRRPRGPVDSKDLTAEHVEDYLERTAAALKKLRVVTPTRSHLDVVASDFLEMAESYHSDGWHFYRQGDLVSAFACVSYAHGWLDAGARLGLWDVDEDDQLFTLAS
jgi:hypothetical protein